MAKFVYRGDEAETTAFGVTFPNGEVVEVNDADKHAVSKLSAHPHFEAAKARAKPEPKPE